MSLSFDEFIRRFLLHVLPKGFHRIRHYGLIANAGRKDNLARARELLDVPETELVVPDESCDDEDSGQDSVFFCRGCGSPMDVIEVLLRNPLPRAPPFIPGRAE